jgi:hypothetical protein
MLDKKCYLRSGSEGEENLEAEFRSPKSLWSIIHARLVFSSACKCMLSIRLGMPRTAGQESCFKQTN